MTDSEPRRTISPEFAVGLAGVALGFGGVYASAYIAYGTFSSPEQVLRLTIAIGGLLIGWWLPPRPHVLAPALLAAQFGVSAWAGEDLTWLPLLALVYVPSTVAGLIGWAIGFVLRTVTGVADHPVSRAAAVMMPVALAVAGVGLWVNEHRHDVTATTPRADEPELARGERVIQPPMWVVQTGKRVGGPVASEGVVFATGGGRLHALNRDGTPRWQFDGAESEPLLANGRVQVISKDSVVSLNIRDGAVVWRASVPRGVNVGYVKENRRRLSAGASGRMYVGPTGDTLSAIDPDGRVAWSFHPGRDFTAAAYEGPTRTTFVNSYSSETAAVHAIDSSGREVWRTNVHTYDGGVAVGPGNALYVAGFHDVYALEGATGRIKWRRRFASLAGTPVVAPNGRVMVPSGGWVVLDANGVLLWVGPWSGRPAFAGDLILFAAASWERRKTYLQAYAPDGHLVFRVPLRETRDPEPDTDLDEVALGPDGCAYVQTPRQLFGFQLPRPPYEFAPNLTSAR